MDATGALFQRQVVQVPASSISTKEFSRSAYKHTRQRPKRIDAYSYVQGLSNRNTAVYVDPYSQSAVVAYRGTQPTRWKDLRSDLAIAVGRERSDPQFQNALAHYNDRVAPALNGYNVTFTGHSLGGRTSDFVQRRAEYAPVRGVNYNIGSGLAQPFRRTPVNQINYMDRRDPISFTQRLAPGGSKRYRSSGWNPHSLRNWDN